MQGVSQAINLGQSTPFSVDWNGATNAPVFDGKLDCEAPFEMLAVCLPPQLAAWNLIFMISLPNSLCCFDYRRVLVN